MPGGRDRYSMQQRKAFIATGLLGAFPRNLKQDVFLEKLDYQLNQTNHLSAVLTGKIGRARWLQHGPDRHNGGVTQNGNGGTHERFFIATGIQRSPAIRSTSSGFQWDATSSSTVRTAWPSVSLLTSHRTEKPLPPPPRFSDEHRLQLSIIFDREGCARLKNGCDVNLIHEVLINLFQGDGNYQYNGTGAFDGCPTGANATFCMWA